ncbi:MAG: hypothetical protein Hals2KO_20090 [Halioglobus sp.]
MPAFDYSTLPFEVRDDLAQAHRHYWHKLATAGSWWSGAERVAIAQEVRNALRCDYCVERKQSLSPYQLPGEHSHGHTLPAVAVDAIHRIVTDQGRITRDWVQQIQTRGLSEPHYVELAAVVVTVFSIDEFNRGLGLPPEDLPRPIPGEPDHYLPGNTESTTGFVAMLPAKGRLGSRERGLWSPGRSANVLRALSLVPDSVRDWQSVADAQYLPAERLIRFTAETGRSINRMQMEIVAGRVSSCNECFY